MERLDSSFLALLKKVDSSFRIRQSQRYTAMNAEGFEVNSLRRMREGADVFLNMPNFDAVIVDRHGRMAMMRTLQPQVFVEFKRWMSGLRDREPIKR
jgi:Nucleotidyltransferase